MTLDEARTWIAGTESSAQRASAQQLLDEALALPQRPLDQRDAAFERIRRLDADAPDYALRSFGASMLETIGESVHDPVLRASMLDQALEHAIRYASSATSGGEGTARSRHVHEIEARLHPPAATVVPAARVEADASVTVDAPRVAPSPASRATALTMIVLGGLGSVGGAALGALFISATPLVFQKYADALPFVGRAGEGLAAGEAARFLYGAAIVLVILFEPAGLAGLARRFRRRGRDPGGGAASAPAPDSSPRSTTDVPSDRPAQGSST